MESWEKVKSFIFVELTDTFGGEANYSWIHRYKVAASSFNGAIRKVSKDSFHRFRYEYNYGDMVKYKATGACVCAFVEKYNELCHNSYSRVIEL